MGRAQIRVLEKFRSKCPPVRIANTLGPESIAAMAAQVGSRLTPTTLNKALEADVVIFAVPFPLLLATAHEVNDWTGRILIDNTNPYGVSPEKLNGKASSEIVESAFAGAIIVKNFNHLPARLLALSPAENRGGGA